MSCFVGIDISAQSFDLLIRRDGKNGKSRELTQDAKGFSQAVKILKKSKPTLIVMEATGVYYLDLAVHLTDQGFNVAVINPVSSKRFSELKLSQVKTDAADAALLAEYAEVMKPAPWTPPKAQALALRDIGRQINRITKDKAKTKNRLHAAQAKTSPDVLIEDLTDSIATYERRLVRLTQAAIAVIQEDLQLLQVFNLMVAAKGIGQTSALAILAEFVVLPQDMKAKQVTRHCGLDIRIAQSGTSVRSASRISKAGNVYLRSALFMPAMSAAQHDANTRRFKENLVERGKTKMQANVAVMRKYLTGLWCIYREGQPFDTSKLFNFESQKS